MLSFATLTARWINGFSASYPISRSAMDSRIAEERVIADGHELSPCIQNPELTGRPEIDYYFWDNTGARSVSLENYLSSHKQHKLATLAREKYDISNNLVDAALSTDDPGRCLKKLITDQVSHQTTVDTNVSWDVPMFVKTGSFLMFIMIVFMTITPQLKVKID